MFLGCNILYDYVDYCDIVPKSTIWRSIGVIACVIGMLMVYLIIVALSVVVDFDDKERNAYSIIKVDSETSIKAVIIIKTIFEYHLVRKKINKNCT